MFKQGYWGEIHVLSPTYENGRFSPGYRCHLMDLMRLRCFRGMEVGSISFSPQGFGARSRVQVFELLPCCCNLELRVQTTLFNLMGLVRLECFRGMEIRSISSFDEMEEARKARGEFEWPDYDRRWRK